MPVVVYETISGLIILASTLLFFFYLWRMRGMPPGPWGLPVLGFLPWVDPVKPYQTFTELHMEYGHTYSLRMGEVIVVVLSHPQIIKEVLSRDVFAGRAPLWLTHGLMKNNGIIAVEGEKWKDQRKFVVNCLKTLGVVKLGGKRDQLQSRILYGVKETLNMMEAKQTAGPFDPHEILGHTVGNVMNSLVFGKTFDYEDGTWRWLQHLAEEGVKLVGVAGIINFIPLLRFLPKYSRILKFLKEGQSGTHEVYRRIAEEAVRPDSVLSIYRSAIEEQKSTYYTEEQMMYLLADLFGAGIDTTLATLRWVLLLFAVHTQVQRNVQEELDKVMGSRRHPNLDDMKHCIYTEAAILETMRYRPVVPLGIPHGTLDNTRLAGYRIPAGTMVMINQWALHHDPLFWNEPETFDPKRFINSDNSIRKPDYFNPFQNGKRVCVGELLAKMTVFLNVAGIVKNYSMTVDGDPSVGLEGICGITLSPGPHKILFIPR